MKSITQLLETEQRNGALNFKALLQSGAVLLDVRTAMEFTRTGLSGSHHIPLDQLRSFIREVKSWKGPIITYSTHGRRSKKAAGLLRACGIEAIDGGPKRILELLLLEHRSLAG